MEIWIGKSLSLGANSEIRRCEENPVIPVHAEENEVFKKTTVSVIMRRCQQVPEEDDDDQSR